MDIDNYIKNNFDDLISNFVNENLTKLESEKYNKKKVTIINPDVNDNDNDNDNDDDDDDDDDNDDDDDDDDDGFYTKEDIYGEYDEDEYDERTYLSKDEYVKMDIFLKNEKNNLSEENENYKEETQINEEQLEEGYEKMYNRLISKKEEDEDEDENENKEFDEFEKEILNNVKINTEFNKKIGIENKDEMFRKINKIKIGTNKIIKNIADIENKNNDNENIDPGEYILNIINLYMMYYNKKFGVNKHFFSELKEEDNDTNIQMNLFLNAIDEYEYIKKVIFMEKVNEFYFDNKEKVSGYIDDDRIESFYVMEINENKIDEKRIYSPSLLDCLNYLYLNNIKHTNWSIYNYK
jgi:hypothetical protein